MMSERTPQATPWTLATLFAGFTQADALSGADAGRSVTGLSLDSRTIAPGMVFLACAGHHGHGMQYAQAALQAGATAIAWEPAPGVEVLPGASSFAGKPVFPVPELSRHAGAIAARYFQEPAASVLPIAVTGTNGKSSVTHFIASVLGTLDRGPAALIGTLGNGFPEALQQADLTTPDPISLQALLVRLRDQGAKAVAIEASSHALDQYRLDAAMPRIAVFTNLTRDHLDYHGSLEAYRDAKARLFQMPSVTHAVINLDDVAAHSMLAGCRESVYRIGITRSANRRAESLDAIVRIEQERIDGAGLGFTLVLNGEPYKVQSSLLGAFNVDNLACAFAVGLALELDPLCIAGALSRCEPVPGRLEAFSAPGKPLVVVDYAHTPAALDSALKSLREANAGPLTCVFGCGGDRDQGKRAQMGEISRQADCVIITNDNPRSEPPEQIAASILAGLGDHPDASVVLDREQAIRRAVDTAGPESVVLVAGKGHERWQEIAGQRLPFCDRSLVRELLGATQ